MSDEISTTANDASANAPVKRRAKSRWNISSWNWRGFVSIACFFLAWQGAVSLELPGFTKIPGPSEVVHTFVNDYLFTQSYWNSWLVSFERVFWGFALAQIIGIPFGLFLGTSKLFNNLVFPVFEMMRPIPPLAWVPLSILFWPTTESSIIFITFIGAFFIITINIYDGVRSIKQEHIWLARSLGASRIRIFRRIMIPAVLPAIAVGMTLGIAVTWNVVIAAEMIASDSGLGRLTWEGYVSSTPPVVIVGMISIGIAGYLSTMIVDIIERRMMPWKYK
ncbi:MAG: ABC transporter permease [Alphaproteobacteria bacterium]|nr:ABC transporter permease [Alphaproteobacteria bacterium]